MNNLERKFGKYAIPNLSMMLILCYGMGYIISIVNRPFMDNYLTLNPYAILHGQVWRLFTWIVSPPSESNVFFLAIMLFFYYSIGTSLERTWGVFRYNVYIFGGLLFTILGSFLMLLYALVVYCGGSLEALDAMENTYRWFTGSAQVFSTYYINMSIFLAFATTYPEMRVLLYFIIPIKVKWMGMVYGAFILVECFQAFRYGAVSLLFAIGASLLNFVIYFFFQRKAKTIPRQQRVRQMQYRTQVKQAAPPPDISIHRCAICGRTEKTDPNASFRFCTKCNGNYEYCNEHLFTHNHIQ